MDEMITFELTISYNDKPVFQTEFLAESWVDAAPQAAEIIAASAGNNDAIVDVKIDRVSW